MNKHSRILGAALAALAFVSSEAALAAPGSIAIVFTPSLTGARTESTALNEGGFTEDRKLGLGGGVLLDFPMADALSIGVGAIYSRRKFQIGTGAIRFERVVPTIFVPAEVKLWMGNAFNIGGGVYGAMKAGDITDRSVLGSGSLEATTTPGREALDYGLTVSGHFLLPFAERTGLLLGARYLYGLSDYASSALYDEKVDDFMGEIGLSFSL